MIEQENITGIILAGGKSSRMGTDKGLITLEGITFTERIISAMNPLVKSIIIVSNTSEYDGFGYQRIEDVIKDSGPLAGLYTGLHYSKTEYNLVLSCDVPLINSKILKKLVAEMDYTSDVIQFQSQGKTIPLVAFYRKRCMYTCLELLEQGEKRLRVAIDHLNTKTIAIDSKMELYVKNINTKNELNDIQNEVEH